MKKLKALTAASVLVLSLSLTALAGEMPGPGVAQPGETHGPGIAQPGDTEPGVTQGPGFASESDAFISMIKLFASIL
jgi:hypothetical protein